MAVLTEAERLFAELKTPGGKTKALGKGQTEITIGGVKYVVDKASAAVMKQIAVMPLDEDDDLDAVIAAYQAYMALTDKQKAEVINFPDLKAQMNRIGVAHHRDEATGVQAKGLDWNIRMSVKPMQAGEDVYETLKQSIGDNTLVALFDISLENVLTGVKYQPEGKVTMRMPALNLSGYDSVIVAHYTQDGQLTYIECRIENGEIVWEADSFSYYGVIGGMGESAQELVEGTVEIGAAQMPFDAEVEQAPQLLWLWIVIACAGAAAVVLVILAKQGRLGAKK